MADRVARIIQEPTGLWHWSDDAAGELYPQGEGYPTRRAAIAALRAMGEELPWDAYTHYLSTSGNKIRIADSAGLSALGRIAGQAGRGDAKRRGDSAYYRELVARRKDRQAKEE